MTETLTAEIVTFRTPETPPAKVRELAGALTPWLAATPGFVTRTLSLAEDGTWTDHLLWQSKAQALAAAEKLMSEPAAAPFLQAIDPASVTMTHAPVLLRQSA